MTALLGAALVAAACYALGARLIALVGARLDRRERFPLAFVLGAACLHLSIFATLALKIAYWPVVMIVVLAAICCVPKGVFHKGVRQPLSPALLLFVPFVVLAFFHAWAPESSPDGSGYHLGLVARYFRAHGFERITNNMFASLSGGLEMLFLPAFIVGRHSAAALVHFTFAIGPGAGDARLWPADR